MISKKPFLVVFAISIALIFLMAPVASASHSINPAVATSTNYQPDPTLNTNVSWSTFYNGWNETEYSNGTGNTTINANPSIFYANPISVNASEIQTNAYNKEIGTTYWNNSANWWTNTANGGAINSISSITVNGKPAIDIEMNATAATSNQLFAALPITWSELPSQNLAYDYATITGYAYGTSAQLGDKIAIVNQTSLGSDEYHNVIEIANETTYAGISGYSIENGQSFFGSFPLNMANISMQKSAGVSLGIMANTPVETSTLIHIIITGISITEYHPLTLGQTSKGGNHAVTGYIGTGKLTTFAPSFTWSSVKNGGYTVALSASPNNLTQVQTPLASGNYIEQVQYSGTFSLPSAADLSYGAANITFPLTVPADQVQVLTLGGGSYTSTLGNRTNGTVQLVSGVPPTASTAYYSIVDYTASQWQSISHPAGFFTYDGIAYYYWLAIGAIASLLGLGVGVRHAKTKREETEKVDRITRRGR